MSGISSIMKEIHKRVKRLINGFFGMGKKYHKILGEEIKSYWSSVRIKREMDGMSVNDMEAFCSNYKSIR